MKIVLSRKGFDSSSGGMPSPILPDGTLLSLPIPSRNDSLKYSDIFFEGRSLYRIIKELNAKTRIKSTYTCHLDPDIRDYGFHKEWTPLFGQMSASQTHLEKNNIGVGDMFLFFGLFKEAELKDGTLRYVKGAVAQHILWGYLQVERMYQAYDELPNTMFYHPHATVNRFADLKDNCIYQGRKSLTLDPSYPGYGVFSYHPSLVLTKEGASASRWDLPEFFKNIEITYHSSDSFKSEGYFQSVGRGQEFVIEEHSEVTKWALSKVEMGMLK